jgi:hypothetical protein
MVVTVINHTAFDVDWRNKNVSLFFHIWNISLSWRIDRVEILVWWSMSELELEVDGSLCIFIWIIGSVLFKGLYEKMEECIAIMFQLEVFAGKNFQKERSILIYVIVVSNLSRNI